MDKILYHGSIYKFDKIDVNRGKMYKDFGKGFYATAVKSHAERLALRNKRFTTEIFKKVHNRNIAINAYRYNLVFNCNTSGLNVKIFNRADIDWVKFIIENRLGAAWHGYDIVIGPTADERTSSIIESYLSSIKNNPTDEIYRMIIRDLRPENLPKQYLFATERAVHQTLRFGNPMRVVI